jgi:hypothetical protein
MNPSSGFRRRCFAALLLLAAVVRADTSSAVRIDDDFSHYLDGAWGEPRWRADHVGFRIAAGALEAEIPGERGHAVLAEAPMGSVASVEATVTPRAAAGDRWRTAGVGLRADEHNFWHVALVESPDGTKRFVELSEMLDDRWNAQHEPGSEAPSVEQAGPGDWLYGKTYRLRIAFEPHDGLPGVVGEVLEGDRLVSRCRRVVRGRGVTHGRPMLAVSAMNARFDDVHARIASPVADPPAVVAPIFRADPRWQDAPGPATGFFRTARLNDRWWLADPAGRATLSIGVDHVKFNGHWCESLGYSPYERIAREKYGTPAVWAAEAARRMRAWNFNTCGAGNGREMRDRDLAFTEFLAFGSDFSPIAPLVEKTTWTGWPDVFDPRFERFCDLRARERCAPLRDNPWLLGYFLDNELEWWGKHGQPWGVAAETFKRPAESAGKHALVEHLRRAFHDDIAAFNQAFAAKTESFDALLAQTVPPEPATPAAREALEAFVAEAARRYFQITTDAVRRHDPNHLILGCRFAHNAPDSAWRECGRTCDIVTVNYYLRINPVSRVVEGLAGHLDRIAGLTRRPLMVTEWSYPALDAVDSTGRPLPSRHGAGMRVDTQRQRAFCFAVMQAALFSHPAVVGSQYFMWADEPALGISSTFPEDSNYGLVSESDEPYPDLTAAAARVNARMIDLHAARITAADIDPGPWGDEPKSPAGRAAASTLIFENNGKTFTVDTGLLRLTKSGPNGDLFDRIEFRDSPAAAWTALGHLAAVISVENSTGRDWPHAASIERVEVVEQTASRLVLDVTTRHPRWRAVWRLGFTAGASTFTSVIRRVENLAAEPWTLRGIYYYPVSAIAGDASDDVLGGPNVPNYWRKVASWTDPGGLHFGASAPSGDPRAECYFWKEGSHQHPDAWRKVEEPLAPGGTWSAPADEPVFTLFALRATPADPRPWQALPTGSP